jgi:hypothetical protein
MAASGSGNDSEAGEGEGRWMEKREQMSRRGGNELLPRCRR